MAATVQVDEGQTNPLLEQAQAIGDLPDEAGERPQKQQAVAEPKVGSYEAFMSSFGSPRRWAGRG